MVSDSKVVILRAWLCIFSESSEIDPLISELLINATVCIDIDWIQIHGSYHELRWSIISLHPT